MAEEIKKIACKPLGKSVQGSLHKRMGIANQDALEFIQNSIDDLPVIMAISDGHGSKKSFRSAPGARMAVESAVEVLMDFWCAHPACVNHKLAKNIAEERIPFEIVKAWGDKVMKAIEAGPFTESEMELLSISCGCEDVEAIQSCPLIAYGATVLAALVSYEYVLLIQLGDGDIVEVSESGEAQHVFNRDERHFANETISLCSKNSHNEFKLLYYCVEASPPPLILLSTDGYSNSFIKNEDFLKVAADIMKMISAENYDYVNDNLEGWLEDASLKGSGDDITAGIICRVLRQKA